MADKSEEETERYFEQNRGGGKEEEDGVTSAKHHSRRSKKVCKLLENLEVLVSLSCCRNKVSKYQFTRTGFQTKNQYG